MTAEAANNGPLAIRFPYLHRIELHDFSLFAREPNVVVELSKPVCCLAGANGIGKSTFIASVNFAITGRVPEPGRRFESVDEYFLETIEFTKAYFGGRISESERETASISVSFSLGEREFAISRDIARPQELSALRVTRSSDGSLILDGSDLAPVERNERYSTEVTGAAGLETFAQFVFLQLFLVTFDERRHLLFWDIRALEQLLFLAFGVSPETARLADGLRRQVDRLDSNVRNYQYDATRAKAELARLRSAMTQSAASNPDLAERAKNLIDGKSNAEERLRSSGIALEDADLRYQELTSRYSAIDREYRERFEQIFSAGSNPAMHPMVRDLLHKDSCDVCGTAFDGLATDAQRRLESSHCPLCGTEVSPANPSEEELGSLESAEHERNDTQSTLTEARLSRDRLHSDYILAQSELEACTKRVMEFESETGTVLLTEDQKADYNALASNLERSIELALTRRAEAFSARDDARERLATLQRNLHELYNKAEQAFVPVFRQLAEAFLGIELSVKLDARPESARLSLVLEVESQARRFQFQLSESQRFFVDIALRMALLQYITSAEHSTMMIDTPEGSLDIAYEKRAGEMFAKFVNSSNALLMTANVNTSQLLLRLAETCGGQTMSLVNMTNWAVLSEVQQTEHVLFDQAFASIESRLHEQ